MIVYSLLPVLFALTNFIVMVSSQEVIVGYQDVIEDPKPMTFSLPENKTNLTKEDFTWWDAFKLYPITIPLFVPLHVMNALIGGNGLGYQKFVPQFVIPHHKRIRVNSTTFLGSWKH